jgi:hypothetical protein
VGFTQGGEGGVRSRGYVWWVLPHGKVRLCTYLQGSDIRRVWERGNRYKEKVNKRGKRRFDNTRRKRLNY